MLKPRIIAHRGNLHGPDPEAENHPNQIKTAIGFGFHVEVDVQKIEMRPNGAIDLIIGHEPDETIIWPWHDWSPLKDRLYFHCKNMRVMVDFTKQLGDLEYFFHDTDDVVMTSTGLLWFYPSDDVPVGSKNIWVLPEIHYPELDENFFGYGGFCTDYPILLKNNMETRK